MISVCLSTLLQAQEGEVKMTNPNGAVVDTFNNTTAEGPYMKVPATSKSVGFVLKLTSNTGTVAGKVYIQGGRTATDWAFPYVDSVTLAAGTNNWQMSVDNAKFGYYRLWVVPTGTQQTIYSAYGYIRKLPK